MTSPALLPAPCIDLAATLDGGQAFCWWEDGGGYRGVLGRRVLRLSAGEGGVEVEALDGGDVSPLLSGLRDYLGLDDDLDALRGRHADDPPVMEAMQHCPGLRLLRQDPWECLVGFICSANSSVRKIKADVAAIARAYGDRLPPGKDEHDYAFPSPEQLARADETDLRGLRLGFRAPCVAAAARAVAEGRVQLEPLRAVPYLHARAMLMTLPGVGPKIADCILAFSFGKREAFPVDRWVRKAMLCGYDRPEWAEVRGERLNRIIADWGRGQFGQDGAYVNQYLFYEQYSAGKASTAAAR